MKEELIRIDNGVFLYENQKYQFDIDISRGEGIGIYIDDYFTSGSAFLGLFNGISQTIDGKIFINGYRVDIINMQKKLMQYSSLIDKHRFTSKELTAWDYIISIGKNKTFTNIKYSKQRFYSEQSQDILRKMKICIDWKASLSDLSMLDYYKLALYKAWYLNSDIIVLNRITEILRPQDLEDFMNSARALQCRGSAFLILDMDYDFMFKYTNRVDVIKNRRTYFRIYPDEYDECRLLEILGWKKRENIFTKNYDLSVKSGDIVLQANQIKLNKLRPMTFSIRAGEIAFLEDKNYCTVSQIKKCLLGNEDWISGEYIFNGVKCDRKTFLSYIGSEIGIQIEMPDRKGRGLFDNMTAIENISSLLLVKAGKKIIRNKIEDSIAFQAEEWFDREKLKMPISQWTLPDRLKLSYYKWYVMNPRLLVCLFPFTGQEPIYHEMIIEMLVMCAERGMAIWIISSGIDSICEKTNNIAFLDRLRYL